MSMLLVCAVLLTGMLIYGYCSNFIFRAEQYTVPVSGLDQGCPVRIVMLADLHGSVFGRNNDRLIRKIKSLHPDMICVAGDMTVKDGRGASACIALCREMVRLCPVYYAMGNHEIRMEHYEDFCLELKKAGVFVLDNEHVHFAASGTKIGVYGWSAGEWYYHKCWQKRVLTVKELEHQLGVPEQGEFHILLAHNPEYFQTYCEWGADLVLSGHVHGGIARLPWIGGVISPSLRLFPKYDAGKFREQNGTMILSRGLGTHHIRLRFFNIPEISVIVLRGKIGQF